MYELIALVILFFSSLAFVYRRSFRYLSALQQDEYSARRFFAWFLQRKAFDKKGSLVALIALICTSAIPNEIFTFALSCCLSLAYLFLAVNEFDPRKSGKVKLVMTERARKIFFVHIAFLSVFALVLSLGAFTLPAFYFQLLLSQIIIFQVLPLFLIMAVLALSPVEKLAQENYLGQAKAVIETSRPYIIAVTGSFGKTSTKNALGEILQIAKGSTFWPKKGINTLMGNTREIRAGLNSSHSYAVIEMGAYRKGSIEKLCRLVPPQAGIITATRSMHLERFGGEESIYNAKTELARAIPQDGILVCNADDAGALRAAKEFTKATTILYGFSKAASDCQIKNIKMSAEGSTFQLNWKGREYAGTTGLIGKPALSNVMAVFSMACALGANPKFVLAAISNLKPVDNRLSLEKHGNVIYLKDAYNSNPVGFEAALDVLKELPGKRKILMTPGMIELGDQQDAENQKIARLAASVCDLVCFVGKTNLKAFENGLQDGAFDKNKFLYFDHRDQALPELQKLQRDGDVILIENDLPDWYEDASGF